MNRARLLSSPGGWWRGLLLTGALYASAIAGSAGMHQPPVTQSIVWLPTGVAIAGLWLLGLRHVWAVALATVLHRVSADYTLSVIIPAALGSSGEAVVGVLILRRLGLRPDFARLRDVVALFAAACAAPLVSILASRVGRSLPGTVFHVQPFQSGWGGWWRMNVLGALSVVPLVLTWSARPRERVPTRVVGEAMAVGAATIGILWGVMTLELSGTAAVSLLYAVLPVALYAALRFGPRGATSVASLSAVFVALATVRGIGPFLSAPLEERHVGAQIFELALVCVPLVLGALVAERAASDAQSRALEVRLRQSQKLEAVGKLAGGIAHDFNNLLAVVRGYAETIKQTADGDGATDVELRDYAQEILAAAQRGAGLTLQLLAFSRQQVLTPRDVDLAALIVHCSSMLRRLIGTDVTLVTGGSGPAWVHADRGQLEQVLLNLTLNARDAMPGGGTLTLTTSVRELDAEQSSAAGLRPGPHVELTVVDTGTGMSPEVQARAFEPFFTTKAPGKGTGLGLATVYGIVQQSGGAIVLDTTPGAGTRVRVLLPRASPAEETAASVPGEPVDPQQATVLVVEDERAVRELLCRILEDLGCTVIPAGDGQYALLAAARVRTIDLLLTDIVMPRMGGIELARRLARAPDGIPVLFVSGHARDLAELDLASFAAADFLQKPFALAELQAKVDALLRAGRRRASQAVEAPPPQLPAVG